MRARTVIMLVGVAVSGASAGTALAGATTAYMRFEVNGSSVVQWDDVKDGFAMDIIVGNNDPLGMVAFQVKLGGDAGFAYEEFTPANYNYALNWVGSGLPPAGNLPMTEAGLYLGATCRFGGQTPLYAQNGRGMTVLFTTAPPRGTYVIDAISWPLSPPEIGDSDYRALRLGDPGFTFTPLTILVPEPAALMLLALGGLAVMRRR